MSGQGELWTPNRELPPREFWLFDPKQEKIPTPVDHRGLVDSIKVAEILRSVIDRSYKFILPSDDHHKYPNPDQYTDDLEYRFRNSTINIVRKPRDAHVLSHYLLEDPKKPDPEVMLLLLEAFDVTTGIYEDASEVVRLERHRQRIIDGMLRPRRGEFRTEASRQRGIDFHKRRFEERLSRYEKLPSEAVLERVSTSANIKNIAKKLGASAVIRRPKLRLTTDLSAA